MSASSVAARRGFVSVQGSRGAPIIARLGGSYVWARRVLPRGPGWHPAPACLFYPAAHSGAAAAFARAIAVSLGWRVWVQHGGSRSDVVGQVADWPAPWVVKVALPPGMRARAAHALVWPLYPWHLAWA